MKRLIEFTSLFLAIIVLLAACGGGGAGANSATLDATMTDFKFAPNTWTVSAGQSVSIKLTNNGSLSHTWTIMSKPITGSYTSADQANILYTSPIIPANSSTTVTFTAPSTAGTYQVICTQPGHFESGMVGQLTVK